MKNRDATARIAGPGKGRSDSRPNAQQAIGSATSPLIVTSLNATLYGIGSATTAATPAAAAITTRPRWSAGTTQPDSATARSSSTRTAATTTLDGPRARATTKSDGSTM